MKTKSNVTEWAQKFAAVNGFTGLAGTEPKECDYERLGAEFLSLYPDVLAEITPSSFETLDEYIEHICASGRGVNYHISSKLISCYE
jgi:hypothetical protein